MSVKPIETVYAGCLFRSRLEARWAVFFDALEIPWQYEPEGFEKDGDRYLPDFKITDRHGNAIWVEVKGDPSWLADNVDRVRRWMSGEPIVPGGKIALLGDIPRKAHGPLVFTMLGAGGSADWRIFCTTPRGPDFPAAGDMMRFFVVAGQPSFFRPVTISAPMHFRSVSGALEKARMARFEHGESGAR